MDLGEMLEKIDWTMLVSEVPAQEVETQKKIEKIKRILYVLKNNRLNVDEINMEHNVIKMAEKLCRLLCPPAEMGQYSVLKTTSKDIEQTYHLLINMCLECMDILISLFSFLVTNPQINDKITQALATYQIKTDPWTSLENYNLSLSILKNNIKYFASEDVLERVLMDGIRPYFISQQNDRSCIRNIQLKTEKPLFRPYENVRGLSNAFGLERWKTERIECVSILEWTLFICQVELFYKSLWILKIERRI